MLNAFLTGFFLGTSLILAIVAQNAFVLRQGILRQHVFYVALFCSAVNVVGVDITLLFIVTSQTTSKVTEASKLAFAAAY